MTRIRFLFLFGGLLLAPLVSANSSFVGPFYGQMTVDSQDSSFEVQNGMLGIAVGGVADSGVGFELFYATHLNEDDIESDGDEIAEGGLTTFAVLAIYRTPGRLFAKLKGGFSVANLEIEFNDGDKIDDDASGLAYGAAVGYEIGNGALELGYLVMPEFNDFEGLDFDADVDLITLGYNWNF